MVDVDPAFRTFVALIPPMALTSRSLAVFRFGARLAGMVTRPVAGVEVQDRVSDGARVRVYQP